MAFNLKKVLKALLLSSSQPLAIKDIQAAFTRFHDAQLPLAEAEETPVAGTDAPAAAVGENGANGAAPHGATTVPALPVEEPAEVIAEPPQDPELYSDVPTLITGTQIREAMDLIAAELRASDDGLLLIEGNAGYRLVTHPRFARWVRILRQEPPPVKLSQSAVETLAVIAYRQPVTRGEIETIRGVSAEAGLNKLLDLLVRLIRPHREGDVDRRCGRSHLVWRIRLGDPSLLQGLDDLLDDLGLPGVRVDDEDDGWFAFGQFRSHQWLSLGDILRRDHLSRL